MSAAWVFEAEMPAKDNSKSNRNFSIIFMVIATVR